MKHPLIQRVLEKIFRLLPPRWSDGLTRLFSGRLKRQIEVQVTDDLLGLLLGVMDLAFVISKDFRRNIKGFRGKYVFATEPAGGAGVVEESIAFADGAMRRFDDALSDYNVKVTFSDPATLRKYVLSTEHDILDLMLENKVTVEGNVNYVYRFLFMVSDLFKRIGIQ